MEKCRKCDSPLSRDEIAIYRRLINRGAPREEALCKSCLARELGVGVDAVDAKIEHFKKAGCTLF